MELFGWLVGFTQHEVLQEQNAVVLCRRAIAASTPCANRFNCKERCAFAPCCGNTFNKQVTVARALFPGYMHGNNVRIRGVRWKQE